MSETETRQEILDLLARGKITIDEAVELLDRSVPPPDTSQNAEPLFKAEMEDGFDAAADMEIEVDEPMAGKQLSGSENEFRPDFSLDSEGKHTNDGNGPRWLRVQVVNSETGKNKVSINVPFGMIKFGLGIARVFSPEVKGIDIAEMSELFAFADAGLLVDVQDEESNERVKIFVD